MARLSPWAAAALFASSSASAAGPLKVVVVDAAGPDLPLSCAIKAGCAASRGLVLDLVVVSRGATAVLASGKADVSVATPLSAAAAAYAAGAEIRVLAVLPPLVGFYGISRFPPAEARGITTVAMNSSGFGAEERLKPFLDSLGLERGAVGTVMARDEAEKYALLERGYADFFTASSMETVRKARADKRFYVLADPSLGKDMPAMVLLASGKALRKRGPDLEKFVSAVYCGLKAAETDKDMALGLLIKEHAYSKEEAAEYYGMYLRAARDLDYAPRLERIGSGAPSGRPLAGLPYPAFARKALGLKD